MKRLSLFSACSVVFNFIFIDQYGVLHDGRRPYPGAIDALTELKARGTQVVILSNSGRSGETNARRMEKLGISRNLYDHFLTSGDVAKAALVDGKSLMTQARATKCMTLSSSGEH